MHIHMYYLVYSYLVYSRKISTHFCTGSAQHLCGFALWLANYAQFAHRKAFQQRQARDDEIELDARDARWKGGAIYD